ncbi:MAG TPA: CHASE sensor domain-containing protein, partial [Clostridia bacterium]|nr:CHASE sensor domain-containing protein [Clostridia bacterium]
MKAIMLTSGLVLFLAATALVAYELVSLRRFMAEHLTSLAHALAENSAGPLAFENRSEAEQVLASLKDEPHFQAAALYDRDGRLFVTFPKGAPSIPAGPGTAGYSFGPGILEVFHPVEQAGNKLGTLYLRSGLGAIREHMLVYGLIALGVAAGSLLAGFMISEKLQQPISKPVMALVQTARTVTQRNDYSVRAQKLGGGELGLLTEAFNQMLDKVQGSDQALRQANREIEQRAQEAEEGRLLLAALMGNINEGITVTGGPPDFPIVLVS